MMMIYSKCQILSGDTVFCRVKRHNQMKTDQTPQPSSWLGLFCIRVMTRLWSRRPVWLVSSVRAVIIVRPCVAQRLSGGSCWTLQNVSERSHCEKRIVTALCWVCGVVWESDKRRQCAPGSLTVAPVIPQRQRFRLEWTFTTLQVHFYSQEPRNQTRKYV